MGLLGPDPEKWERDQAEMFFAEEHGIYGPDGRRKDNPRSVFVPDYYGGGSVYKAKEIKCELSGRAGFLELFEKPYCR